MKTFLTNSALAGALFCLLFSSSPRLLFAQKKDKKPDNLVLNPSFEDIAAGKSVTLSSGIEVSEGWSAPTSGESLLYTTKDKNIYDPNGSSWPFKARTGKNVAGMNVYGGYGDSERREYIQGSLKEPLAVGKRYYFEFYVHYHCEGANNIGIAFLPKKISVAEGGLLKLAPVSYQKKVTPYNNDKNTWTLVRDTFVALEAYQNFVIGNFFPNSKTEVESSKYSHYFAYIDDIVVAETAEQPQTPPVVSQTEKEKWEYNKQVGENTEILTQKPVETVPEPKKVEDVPPPPPPAPVAPPAPAVGLVQFEAASATLSAESSLALDGLAQQMTQNPSLKLFVKGFASSEGSKAFNQTLSENRAQTVRNYLTGKGIDASRISVEAFGEENPVAENDTPEGRTKNRRVEIGWSEK
jgi:outer membrane protein OmpA-like peptidoglycan-associated protein